MYSPNYHIKVKTKQDEHFNFVEIIRTLLSNGEVTSMNMLGHDIRVWQEKQGFEDVNSKTFLVRCGLKPSAGLMNTIRELMGDEIEITGDEPPFTIRMLK